MAGCRVSLLRAESLEASSCAALMRPMAFVRLANSHRGLRTMRTLRDVLARLTEERLDYGRRHIGNLQAAIGCLEKAVGLKPLTDLGEADLRAAMRYCLDESNTAVTANNYRKSLLYLWESAERFHRRDPRDGWNIGPSPRKYVPKLKEVERKPTAWTPDQFAALVAATRTARTRRGWGPKHWQALIMVVYDTSLRIGCLLKSKLSQLYVAENRLLVPGELQKGRADTWQPLHPETVRLLSTLPRKAGDDRLIPWPYYRDELWRKYTKEILIPAGLPFSHRDKFHRIRRTSYTMVAKAFGIAAASEHAAHKQDLSKFYLDTTLLERHNPLDALPRPITSPNQVNPHR